MKHFKLARCADCRGRGYHPFNSPMGCEACDSSGLIEVPPSGPLYLVEVDTGKVAVDRIQTEDWAAEYAGDAFNDTLVLCEVQS